MRNEGGGISARGPGRNKRTAGQSARLRGEVSVKLTASDIVSVAVNYHQNRWRCPDWLLNILGCESIETLDAMLDEVYDQILESNRLAVEKRLAREAGQTGKRGKSRKRGTCLSPDGTRRYRWNSWTT